MTTFLTGCNLLIFNIYIYILHFWVFYELDFFETWDTYRYDYLVRPLLVMVAMMILEDGMRYS